MEKPSSGGAHKLVRPESGLSARGLFASKVVFQFGTKPCRRARRRIAFGFRRLSSPICPGINKLAHPLGNISSFLFFFFFLLRCHRFRKQARPTWSTEHLCCCLLLPAIFDLALSASPDSTNNGSSCRRFSLHSFAPSTSALPRRRDRHQHNHGLPCCLRGAQVAKGNRYVILRYATRWQ